LTTDAWHFDKMSERMLVEAYQDLLTTDDTKG